MPSFAASTTPIVGVSVFLFAAAAAAQSTADGGLSLDWEAPPGCPGRDAVLERTNALTSRTAAAGEAIRARGLITAQAAGGTAVWRLTLETTQRSRSWQRSVDGTSCDELTEAGALILALAIDPTLASRSAMPAAVEESTVHERGETPGLAPPHPPATGSAQPVASSGVPRAASQAPRELEFSADASAIGDFGSLPRPALGFEGAIGLAGRRLRLEAFGTFLPEVRAEVAQAPSRGGDIGLWALGGRGGYSVRWLALSVEGRLGFELGQMRGTGFGGTAWNTERSSLWAAGRAGVSARLDSGRFYACAAAEAVVPVVRPEFVFEGLDQVHRPAAVVGRVALGVGAHF